MGVGNVESERLVAGRYELDCELARGGMGVVYRAIDRTTGQEVALKRSLDDENPEHISRTLLRREYQTLVTLRHPHIIDVYDFGTDHEGPYYTMELLRGADLRASCPLPWRDVCAYLRDIASSLALLHSRRLLHRDVSVANIRLTSGGRAKLLDFGALTSFGRASLTVGAPPTTSPEVLDGAELDGRVDLYALGATAYCALTGRHAYPAPMLSLLRTIWAQGAPRPPSQLVSGIPPELDELVLSLLDLDPPSRPASAAEVMERLSAIAGLPPEHDPVVAHSYLLSAGIVGRTSEREALARWLSRTQDGHGAGVVITAGSGVGKSVLLEELAQRARVEGVTVLSINARAHGGPRSAWLALVQKGLPGAAPGCGVEAFCELAESRALVLAVDDAHEADRESVALLTALAKKSRRRRILLVATVDPSHPNVEQPALRSLLGLLRRVELRPFESEETTALVRGLFGDVTAAQRLGTFLHDHTAGHPRACTEMLALLIEQGTLRYTQGTWILPHELPTIEAGAGALGALTDAVFERRIAHWSHALRALALRLSVERRVLDATLIAALTEGEQALFRKDMRLLLDDLVREGVLVEGQGSYAFTRPRIQELLYNRLPAQARLEQHRRLACALERTAGDDPRRGFEVAFHFLMARDEAGARRHFDRNLVASFLDADLLIEAVPDMRAMLEELRRQGASDEDVQFVEGTLVISGFYLDPSVYDRFAERCLPLLHRTMGFALANRLSPWLSRPVALVVGLSWAWLRTRFRRQAVVNGGPFLGGLLALVGVCASLSAGACFRIDKRMHAYLRELLDVARGLGRHNSFRLIFDLFAVGGNVVRGRLADAERGLEDQLERVPRIAFLTDDGRDQFEAGLELFMGRLELQRLGGGALERAARIEELGAKHYRLLAQLLRRTYYLYRGEIAAVKREEARFDQLAALFGSRWVPDLVSVLEFIPYHLSGDVLGLRQTLNRIDGYLTQSPGLKTHREVIAAMYEGHRGRPARALEIYAEIEGELEPFSNPVWSLARGHQAECLNALDRPAEALVICDAARAQLSEVDRVYVFSYQQLEREAAHALAKLGRFEEAVQLADKLLAECEGFDNPLVRGLLHADRARIACLQGDAASFESHATASRASFLVSGNPALMTKSRRLSELGRAGGFVLPDERGASLRRRGRSSDPTPGPTQTFIGMDLLREVVDATGARAASLYLVVGSKPALCAQVGQDHLVEIEEQVSKMADSFDQNISVVTQSQGRLQLVPLLALVADGRELVGVLALQDCARGDALDRLDLSRIVSELVCSDSAVTEAV